jgi:VWFA-related protein
MRSGSQRIGPRARVSRSWQIPALTFLCAGALSAAAFALAPQSRQSQQPPAPQQQAPAKQSASPAANQTSPPPVRVIRQMVQLDVIATDRSGKPARDLKQSDFTVYDNGKKQDINWFSMETNDVNQQSAAAQAKFQLPPNTYSNLAEQKAPAPGNLNILLIDFLNSQTVDIATARADILRMLAKMQPNDRMAIYALTKNLVVVQDFTTDMSALLRALNSVGTTQSDMAQGTLTLAQNPILAAATGGPGSNPTLPDDSSPGNILNQVGPEMSDLVTTAGVQLTLEAFEDIAAHVADMPGRKNLIWISASFPFTISPSSNTSQDARDLKDFHDQVDFAVRSLSSANVSIYPVDVRGLIGAWSSTNNPSQQIMSVDDAHVAQSQAEAAASGSITSGRGPTVVSSSDLGPTLDTMKNLADATGGRAFYNRNDVGDSVRDAIDDSRVSYAIAYYPAMDDWHGTFHKLRVTVDRPGIELRYRSGYYAVPPDYAENVDTKKVWHQAISNPLDATGVGVVVHVDPRTVAGGQRKLAMVIGIPETDITFDHSGDRTTGKLEVALAQFDSQGNQVASELSTVDMKLLKETYARKRNDGLGFVRYLPLDPKAASVRVVVRDAKSNALGSVTIPLGRLYPATPSQTATKH